ncbi:MAG: hypothetical protein U5O39_17235 [Gammaproteobacteria bacterium]|nr:hypothetical protein [Gammaproteobacteria bacterium]
MTRHIHVSVRELVAFSELRGDINFRFSSRSTAVAGIRGHQRLQKRRGDGYVAEKRVSDTVEQGDIVLDISGRVDGYFPGTEPLVVDEIKTVRGEAAAIPASVTRVHRGQARVYGWLLGRETAAANIRVRVCYLQLDDDSEAQFEETLSLSELGDWYARLVQRYLDLGGHARWVPAAAQSDNRCPAGARWGISSRATGNGGVGLSSVA